MTHEHRIALLIDADNSPAGKIDEVLDELAKYGVSNIRRAYGDWKSRHLNAWEEVLHEYAIQPMQQFAHTKRKNATDSAMIIDAMDLLYTKQLDGFGIVSSDSDFPWLRAQLDALTAHNEASFPEAWAVSDAPPDYIERIMEAIVGVEMVITKLLGKWKVSRNQPSQNQASVVSGLKASGRPESEAMAALVEERGIIARQQRY